MTIEEKKMIVRETREMFAKQQKYSASPAGNVCLYRGPEGSKCAVGLWIQDEDYDPSIEGAAVIRSSVIQRLLKNPKLSHFYGGEVSYLFIELQAKHDNAATNGREFGEFLKDLQLFEDRIA